MYACVCMCVNPLRDEETVMTASSTAGREEEETAAQRRKKKKKKMYEIDTKEKKKSSVVTVGSADFARYTLSGGRVSRSYAAVPSAVGHGTLRV